jgi:BON domain
MLDWAVYVPADAVWVEVTQRKITLTGVVTWDFQREAVTRGVLRTRSRQRSAATCPCTPRPLPSAFTAATH